jgi:hypothetical protein
MLLLRGLSHVVKGTDQEAMLDRAVLEFSDHSKWAVLDRLLTRAGWQRTWIIQECVMAKDIILVCGYRELP